MGKGGSPKRICANLESPEDRRDVCQRPWELPTGGQRILHRNERSPRWTTVFDFLVNAA